MSRSTERQRVPKHLALAEVGEGGDLHEAVVRLRGEGGEVLDLDPGEEASFLRQAVGRPDLARAESGERQLPITSASSRARSGT